MAFNEYGNSGTVVLSVAIVLEGMHFKFWKSYLLWGYQYQKQIDLMLSVGLKASFTLFVRNNVYKREIFSTALSSRD